MILEENWQAFKASVNELNAYLRPSVLRKYQSDLLNFGHFAVVSPISGKIVEVTRSIQFDENIAYLIPDRTKAWLVAGFIQLGFPLYELVTQEDCARREVVEIRMSKHKRLHRSEVDWLIANGLKRVSAGGRADATLVIGHPHFAHHLWNELPALDEWLYTAPEERLEALSIFATCEPIGPLQEIFPRLASANIVIANHEQLQDPAGIPLAVRVGSRLVTRELRQKVREFSERHAGGFLSHPARLLLDSSWPRIWVSVRLGSRTADNMEAFLLHAFRKILEHYTDAIFLLNGYAFPFGCFDDPRTLERHNDKARAQARSADDFISNLCRMAQEQLGSRSASRIQSISGLDLPAAIQFGAYCDYYICHAGALQHMVAWLHDIPGIVHSPRLTKKDATYNIEGVECGISPDLVPRGLIMASKSRSRNAKPRNVNYEFVDLEKTAQFVLDSMQSRLGRVSPTANL